jgi:hypothetical protein
LTYEFRVNHNSMKFFMHPRHPTAIQRYADKFKFVTKEQGNFQMESERAHNPMKYSVHPRYPTAF